ncbi:MAG: MATE family efflux transporter [Dehalococcoidales bacterium]|nr:MATE family efflux transporter [Dehalococcoidales bacterium]
MQKYTERLGYAPIGRLLLSLSVPGIAAAVTMSLYNIVDTFWVARLGYGAIAALTIIFPYQIMFFTVGNGTGIGLGALVSRQFGEKKPEATNHAAGQIYFLSVIWGLIFILVPYFLADSILSLMGATPDIMEYCRQYLIIISFGAPLIIFSHITSSLIRGSGDAVKPMIITISACVINIILDPFLIFGIGPFPEMGISGAAWATTISQGCGALLSLYYLVFRKTAFITRPGYLVPDLRILRDIYRVGASAMILQITESLAFILFNKVVSNYGSINIAAMGLAMRISDLAFMPIIGLSNGLLPIVGYNFGSKDFKRMWHSVKLASISIVVLLLTVTIFIEILAPQIISLFSEEEILLSATAPVMRIMLSTLCLVGPTMLFITAFQGMSRGFLSLVLSLVRQFFFFVPLLYLFSYIFGIIGVWVSMPASDTLGFIISLVYILREYQRYRPGSGTKTYLQHNIPSPSDS